MNTPSVLRLNALQRRARVLATDVEHVNYCRERWSLSRIHAHRLIDAAVVAENLLPTGNMPTNERQLRPLA